MLRLFRCKMMFVVKYFQGSHFSEKKNIFFLSKSFFGVWRVRKITNIFFIFLFNHTNLKKKLNFIHNIKNINIK
jgi:hypothetical protein